MAELSDISDQREATSSPRAIVLLSGGLDSATVLAMALRAGYRVTALSFEYGQRHRFELTAAQEIAEIMGVYEHIVLSIDLAAIGGSALTSDDLEVPKHADGNGAISVGIPVTYVPARNTIFLSCALGLAETRGAFDIFIGVNAVDYSGYPDCRPAFIEAFETLANLATKTGVEGLEAEGRGGGRYRIRTPLMALSKSDIIQEGLALGVDYGLTHSCYDPEIETGYACGACDACILRRNGFVEAGVADPTRYVGGR